MFLHASDTRRVYELTVVSGGGEDEVILQLGKMAAKPETAVQDWV